MKIGVIGDERLVRGFRLAGLKTVCIARDTEETASVFRQWLGDPDMGVIILPPRLKSEFREELALLDRKRRAYPVVVAVGTAAGSAEEPKESEFMRMAGME